MSERQSRFPWPMLAASICVLAIALYVSGYFILGDHVPSGRWVIRGFTSHRVAVAYAPMAWAEAKLRRRTVGLTMPRHSGKDMLIFDP